MLSSAPSRSVPKSCLPAPLTCWSRGVSHVPGVISLDANPDAMVTRSEGAYLLGVDPAVIGMWRARGWVEREPDLDGKPTKGQRRYLTVKRAPDGTLRYRLGDLVAAELHTRRSKTPRRRVHVDPFRRLAAI